MNTDNEKDATGMNEAIKLTNQMDLSQAEREKRLEYQREQYKKLQKKNKSK